MDIVFLACWAVLPLVGSLLLAARLWGKQSVIKFVREAAFNVRWVLDGFARRLLRAARALVAVEVDTDDLRSELIEELEEVVSYKVQNCITLLSNKIYALEQQVKQLSDSREQASELQGDRY